MNCGGEGIGAGTRCWIGPVGDLIGGLGDAAGAQEGGPVGGVGAFVKRVAGFITQLNRVQRPAASSGEGIKFPGGIESARQGGPLKIVSTERQRPSLAGGAGAKADTSVVKAGEIIRKLKRCREVSAPRL